MIDTKGGVPLEAVVVEAGVVQLRGDFDAGDEAACDQAVQSAGRRRDGSLVIDLSNVTFFGSTALSALLRTIDPVGPTVLRQIPAPVVRVLDITGTAVLFSLEI